MKCQCPHCERVVEIYRCEDGKPVECPACENLFVLNNSKNNNSPEVCPFCANPLNTGDIICINCGYNLKNKGLTETHIEGEESLAPLWKKFLFEIFILMPGLLKPAHLILFIISLPISVFLVFMGLALLGFGLLFTTIMMCAFAMIVYAQGISFLFNDRLELVNQAFIDFHGLQLTLFLCAVFAPAFIIFLLMMLAANAN